MRILHLPTTVGGGPSGLSAQLRALGFESEVWSIGQNYLGYPADRVLANDGDPRGVTMLKLLWAGRYVFGRWDAVHFNYGSTLFSTLKAGSVRQGPARIVTAVQNAVASGLQRLELAVLAARRIPVFIHYQGDDARQGDYSLEHFDVSIATQVPPGYYSPQTDRRKRREIALMTRQAAGVYAVNPDLMNVLPESAKFVPYGHVDLDAIKPRYTQEGRDRLVFAHAPSNRKVKGTDLILAALAELAAEGYLFDVDLIEGVGNTEALERYAQADVMIDQLYAGWYGGLALEAMAMGKPVVVYLRDSDLRFLPPQMREQLPFFRATPDSVKEVLRGIVEMPRAELAERARASRAYAERWHDPVAITTRIADDYRAAWNRNNKKKGAV